MTFLNCRNSAIRVETDAGNVLDKFVVLRLVSHCKDDVKEQFLRKLVDPGLLGHLANGKV